MQKPIVCSTTGDSVEHDSDRRFGRVLAVARLAVGDDDEVILAVAELPRPRCSSCAYACTTAPCSGVPPPARTLASTALEPVAVAGRERDPLAHAARVEYLQPEVGVGGQRFGERRERRLRAASILVRSPEQPRSVMLPDASSTT